MKEKTKKAVDRAKSRIGKVGTTWWSDATETLKVDVKILNAKFAAGRIIYLITPISGSGQIWKREDYVYFKP